jgi:DNA (cytosine-5)-methyltransferase 1
MEAGVVGEVDGIMRPKLLDLFCGAGGCSMGYHRAGFDVVGVDIKPQPHYPFEFIHADALATLKQLSDRFDAIHASPPCQAYSTLQAMHKGIERADWVIENVVGAPLRFAARLCGSSFGLGATVRTGKFHQLRRHRLFESNFLMMSPPCQHKGRPVGVYGHGGGNANRSTKKGVNGFTGSSSERREAMGIDWMTRGELSQAIPPAYTEYIGQQLLRAIA